MLTFICYVEVYYFSLAFLDCVCHNEDFIKLRVVIYWGFVPYCLIIILAGLKKIVCHTKDFVIWRFVKSRFYCSIVRPLKESPSGERQGTYTPPASISGCSLGRLRVVPHFSSGIVERAKRERAWKSTHARKGDTRRGERNTHIFLFPCRVSPFLAWGDFHGRSRFACSTILRKNGGLLVVYSLGIGAQRILRLQCRILWLTRGNLWLFFVQTWSLIFIVASWCLLVLVEKSYSECPRFHGLRSLVILQFFLELSLEMYVNEFAMNSVNH